ncbi:Utp12-domain-containing protein [Ramicandelaber brevisporus]|nr:Utp12-domain-containing protein [Ramicandelaber brevisporus]
MRSYLRYVARSAFGVVASHDARAVFDSTGKIAVSPALQDVILWDVKRGVQVTDRWRDPSIDPSGNKHPEVSCIARNHDGTLYAVGYKDGSVRIYAHKLSHGTSGAGIPPKDASSTDVCVSPVVTFNGHHGAISALCFDRTGTVLASASNDTDIVVWDVVAEVGMYRLKGHRDQITALRFIDPSQYDSTKADGKTDTDEDGDVIMDTNSGGDDDDATSNAARAGRSGYLLSSSKDTLVKLWDLAAQHCVETVVLHRSEVWSMDLSPDASLMVTGSAERDLYVWKLDHDVLRNGVVRQTNSSDGNSNSNSNSNKSSAVVKQAIVEFGRLQRQHGRERVATVKFDNTGRYLICQNNDKTAEVYRIRSDDEVQKKLARREKRKREKSRKQQQQPNGTKDSAADGDDDSVDSYTVQVDDVISQHVVIRAESRISYVDFSPAQPQGSASGTAHVLVTLSSNAIEVYSVPPPATSKTDAVPVATLVHTLDTAGHRSEMRSISLSSDDEMLATASNGLLKIWNANSTACIRTMECGQAVCCAILPGNRYVAVGTKAGDIELFDIMSASLVERIPAHDGMTVWSIAIQPDRKGLVTGGADKQVKFWNFELTTISADNSSDGTTRRVLTLVHTRTLRLSDEALCVRISPDSRLLAVSLLDATVKVFYMDSLKFYLSLYGHKLPVLGMDISTDSSLLVTCSADKNIKLWGLDFGDCHKSIFAHQEAISQVAFVPNTHYFFSISKDKTLKYWDGDKFENIMKLEGHHSDVLALAVSRHGSFVATVSHDRSIRIWQRTDEQLFLEEEREKELETLYEANLRQDMERMGLDSNKQAADGEGGDEDDAAGDVASAGMQTMETLKAGERIMEALEIADEQQRAWDEYNTAKATGNLAQVDIPKPHPLLVAYGNITPDRYVLRVLESIRTADLDDALLVLPFSKVVSLFSYILSWSRNELNTPLTCRILFFLLKTHHNQIVANRMMRGVLDEVRVEVRKGLKKQRDEIGFNVAGLMALKRTWEMNATSHFIDEEKIEEAVKKNTAKRKFVTV